MTECVTKQMVENDDIKRFLDEKVILYNRHSFIETDPIQIPKQFEQKEDIEIAAFMAAIIAWGQRSTIIRNAKRLMALMEHQPYEFVINASEKDLDIFSGFKHRTFNGDDCKYFLRSLKNIYTKHQGLQQVFENGFTRNRSVKASFANFHTIFFEIDGLHRTRKHVSNTATGSPAKRLNMFLRWMVRDDINGVDFGIWKGIPAKNLMLPLDVHTGAVARKLGLLERKQNDWKAVEEVTSNLRRFDPNDPVKYDFALFGLGVFEKF